MTLCSQRVYLLKHCKVRAFQYSSYIWSLWPLYCPILFTHSQPGEGTWPDSYKNAWMLFLNGLESLVFATQVIPQPNYLTDARLFRLVQRPEHCLYHHLPDTIDSCSMELRHRGHSFLVPHCKYNLYKSPLFHDVCLNTFSFTWLYISNHVLCVDVCRA